MPTVRIQEKNYSESIMVLKLKDGFRDKNHLLLTNRIALCIIPDFQS